MEQNIQYASFSFVNRFVTADVTSIIKNISIITAASILWANGQRQFDNKIVAADMESLANKIVKSDAMVNGIMATYTKLDKLDKLVEDTFSLNSNALKREYNLQAEKFKKLNANKQNGQDALNKDNEKGIEKNQKGLRQHRTTRG